MFAELLVSRLKLYAVRPQLLEDFSGETREEFLYGVRLGYANQPTREMQVMVTGLGAAPKTAVIDPKCPTPEQKEVIERNMNLYGAGFSQGYDNTTYARNLLAMAKTLGYPDPTLDDIHEVLQFLRKALKINC